MTIKLIASDLDGTLLNNACFITERTKEAIRKAREKGVLFTFATGRMFRSALPFALELGIDLPLITYEGALVKSPTTKEVLYHCPLPVEWAKEVIAVGDREKLSINVYLDDAIYIHRETQEIHDYCRTVKVPFTKVDDLQSFLDRDPDKVIYIGEEEKLVTLWRELENKFKQQVHITRSTLHFLEFTNPQATKGYGINVLSRSLGIKKEEIMAFGDNFNDLPLLQSAGMAVAMGNATDELKQVADYITLPNNEDGVAKAIEKFVLD